MNARKALLIVVYGVISGCGNSQGVSTEKEFTVASYKQPCTGVANYLCLLTKSGAAAAWEYKYDEVRGFHHEWGHEYDLLVRETVIADAHIGIFAVAPAHQAAGIGARFLAHAEQLAQESGARRAVMQVVAQRSDLVAFYERRGYRRTGETGAYPVNAGVGTPRMPGLTIATLEKYLDASRA